MTIYEGAKIKVLNKDGSFTQGEALELCGFGMENLWLVRYGDETSVFEETELLKWNRHRECVCGSEKVGISNRHAYWCDKNA